MLNLTKSTETSFAAMQDTSFAGIQDGIALAQAIVDTVRDPLLVLDGNQRIVAASRSFHRTFVVNQDLRGLLLHEIGGGQWDIPELRVRLQAMAQDHAAIEGFELDREFPAIGRRVMLLNAREVFYETGTHTTVLLAIEDVTERRAAERQMQELLKEKDMLLQEMQHRVANSLQIIASILLIKARNVKSEETRLQLQDAHQRVLSVAAVQQHLHSAGRGGSIEIGKYLSKLCSTLAESMIGDSQTIALKVDSDQGTLASHDAVSIGLIVTELVMNALKYAFAGGKPDAVILVSYKIADTDWQLRISDNGAGKAEIATGQVKTGLGTSLVQALAKQLDAQVETTSDATGTAVSITHATFKSKPAETGELLPA
jgi:chemotaxis protein methyltransferase CheR